MDAPRDSEAHALLADGHRAHDEGRPNDALRLYAIFIDRIEGETDLHWTGHRGEVARRIGDLHWNREDWASAIHAYKVAADSYAALRPTDHSQIANERWARYWHGASLAQDGRWRPAEIAMSALATEATRDSGAPHDLRFLTLAAMVDIVVHQNRPSEAAEWLALLERAAPAQTDWQRARSLKLRAAVDSAFGRWGSARTALAAAAYDFAHAQDYDESVSSLLDAVSIDRRFEHLQEALRLLDKAIEELPLSGAPRMHALLLAERSKVKREAGLPAVEDARRAVDLMTAIDAPTTDLAPIRHTWAIAADASESDATEAWEGAVEAYVDSGAPSPGRLILLANQASKAMQAGDADRAAELLAEAHKAIPADGLLRADADQAISMATAGFAYLTGDLDRAIEILTDALTRWPNEHVWVRRNLSAAEAAKAHALGLGSPAGMKHARRALVSAVASALHIETGAYQFDSRAARAAFRAQRGFSPTADEEHLAWAIHCASVAADITTVADLIWFGRVSGRAALPDARNPLVGLLEGNASSAESHDETETPRVFHRSGDEAHNLLRLTRSEVASVGRVSAGRLVAPSGRELLSPWRRVDAETPRVLIR